MSTPKSTPEELEELVRLIAKTPPRRRYVLVRRASGELAFVQDELDSMLEQAIAAAFRAEHVRNVLARSNLSGGSLRQGSLVNGARQGSHDYSQRLGTRQATRSNQLPREMLFTRAAQSIATSVIGFSMAECSV
jgi:hypothetical protein